MKILLIILTLAFVSCTKEETPKPVVEPVVEVDCSCWMKERKYILGDSGYYQLIYRNICTDEEAIPGDDMGIEGFSDIGELLCIN